MRADLEKVVKGMAKHGKPDRTWIRAARRKAKLNPEDCDSEISIRAAASWDDRRSGGYGPLEKVFAKHIGRPWDLVYSEFAEVAHPDTVIGRQLRDYVSMVVKLHVVMKDGQPHCHSPYKWWSREDGLTPLTRGELYVNPETGLLCKAPKESRKSRRARKLEWKTATAEERRGTKAQPWVVTTDNELFEYQRIDGIWYLIEYEWRTQESWVDRDGVTKISSCTPYKVLRRKEQLSKRDVKRLKLDETQ